MSLPYFSRYISCMLLYFIVISLLVNTSWDQTNSYTGKLCSDIFVLLKGTLLQYVYDHFPHDRIRDSCNIWESHYIGNPHYFCMLHGHGKTHELGASHETDVSHNNGETHNIEWSYYLLRIT